MIFFYFDSFSVSSGKNTERISQYAKRFIRVEMDGISFIVGLKLKVSKIRNWEPRTINVFELKIERSNLIFMFDLKKLKLRNTIETHCQKTSNV